LVTVKRSRLSRSQEPNRNSIEDNHEVSKLFPRFRGWGVLVSMISTGKRDFIYSLIAFLVVCLLCSCLEKCASAEDQLFETNKQMKYISAGISLLADIEDSPVSSLPTWHATLMRWDKASIAIYLNLVLSTGMSDSFEEYIVDSGKVLLLNDKRLERIAFLSSPDETFHYMTSRSDLFFQNALESKYIMETIQSQDLIDVFGNTRFVAKTVQDFQTRLMTLGVETGEPLQMTVYKASEADEQYYSGIEESDDTNYVIALPRFIQGIKLMSWGQRLPVGDYTYNAYITLYIDPQGISDIQIPLMFSELRQGYQNSILSLDQAIEALTKLQSESFLPNAEDGSMDEIEIDHVVLEYAPIQINDECTTFDLIPVWSFYSNYADDDNRTVISLNAYSGEQVF